MDDSEEKCTLSDSSRQSSTITPKSSSKPKRRSLVERELETSLTARVTSPVSTVEATGRKSRYGRTRQLKTFTDSDNKSVATTIKSHQNEKSPVHKMHASNTPVKTDDKPTLLIETNTSSNIENQIESIQVNNVALSRFSSETNKSNSPVMKCSKIYIKKDLIQGKVKEEVASGMANSFSPVCNMRPSTNTHLNLLLERSMEKYSLDNCDNLNKQNGYLDTSSVVKTLDFDSGKKKKDVKPSTLISKSDIFEREAKCSYQVGDLAWARVGTYPFWPCMVTRDPFSDTFVKKKLFGRVERDVIHVTFLGDNGRRGWIVDNMLREFAGLQEFQDTKAQFTSEDKKKDPKFYGAFFISDKKMSTWNVSVAEAESLMREPKRFRIDALYVLLNTGRETKGTPRRLKSSKVTRTDSDVSLSASLYDTLFSEDDCKEDPDKSKSSSRKTSLDVSEVVTACLDNMAAKTGISMIQKQSHMDIWLQKAKSMTPEKPPGKLLTPKIRVKDIKTSAKKQKTPLKEITPQKYSLRKSALEAGDGDNLDSIRITTSYQINEHDYSKLQSTEITISDSSINDTSDFGIGYISKVETLCDQQSSENNSEISEVDTKTVAPNAKDQDEYNIDSNEVSVACNNLDSDITEKRYIEMDIDTEENFDMDVDVTAQDQIISKENNPKQSPTSSKLPSSVSSSVSFKVTTQSQHIVIEPNKVDVVSNDNNINVNFKKQDSELFDSRDIVKSIILESNGEMSEEKCKNKHSGDIGHKDKQDLFENDEDTEKYEKKITNISKHFDTDEHQNNEETSGKKVFDDNLENDTPTSLHTNVGLSFSEAKADTDIESENKILNEFIEKTSPKNDVLFIPEDRVADSPTFTQREDEDNYNQIVSNNSTDDASLENFDDIEIPNCTSQTYTQPSQNFDNIVPIKNSTNEFIDLINSNEEANIISNANFNVINNDCIKKSCPINDNDISLNHESISQISEDIDKNKNGDLISITNSTSVSDNESLSNKQTQESEKLQDDLKFDTVSLDSNFDDNIPLAKYLKKSNKINNLEDYHEIIEVKSKKEKSRSRKKPKSNSEVDRAKNDPEFIKYLELRQDALLDENPHFTEEDIISYLYKTWVYEEGMKSDTVKSDEMQQSNLVKGLGDEVVYKPKKLSLKREVKKKEIKDSGKVKNEDSDKDTDNIEGHTPIKKVVLSPIKINGVNTNQYKIISNDNAKKKTCNDKVKSDADDYEQNIDRVLKKSIAKPYTKTNVQLTDANKATENPEFLKYLELRQDALLDENPHLNEKDIILYLYKTWIYEESLKSETVKNDEVEQSNLIKGLNNELASQSKKIKKPKPDKDVQETGEVAKPKRKIARAYYNENDTDIEDELQIFEIFKIKSKTKPTDAVSPAPEASSSLTEIAQDTQEILQTSEQEESFDEEEFFFSELTRTKPNLFKGLIRERVCEICHRTGNLVKCKGPCAGTFHVDCTKKEVEPVALPTQASRGRKKKKPRGRKPKSLDDSESQSDEKSQIEDISLDEDNIVIDAESFESQLSVKMKALLELENNVEFDFSSEEDLNWNGTVAGKCEIVDVKLKLKIDGSEYADFKCNSCTKHETPLCFVCKSVKSPKQSVELRQRCQNAHCHKFYHLECLDIWPQTQFISGEPSKNNKRISEHFEAMTCPRHVCHTCVSDDPRGCKTRFSGDKLARCIKCPATYHSFTKCLPAGSTILSGSFIICPRHYEHRPGKVPCHVNTGWCFICALGGTLICCEYCPTSFHAECLNIAPPEGNYMCEDCETGRLPLYGEMVWVKLGHYRWWPGIILHPSEIPENIMAVKHSQGEFVVRFFGQYDHYWVNRGRVFPFQEGDSGRISSQKSKIDEAFTKAMEHAHKACEILKLQPDTLEEADIASSLLPPHYVKLRVNKPCVTSVMRRADDADCSLSSCDCDVTDPAPCARHTACLNRMLLTECGPSCRAGDRCQNRAFERREYPNMTPYRTPHRGWGLRTLEDIKEGQFVIEYVGEIIDEEEFRRRMARQHEVRDENFYFLTLDKDRMIDAGPKGNLARFMNHSCEPNCETQKWTVLGDVRVGLFALFDIPANSELTFNYNLECAGIDKKPCFCGAKRCSGYIGAKPKQEEVHPKKTKLPGTKRTYKKRKPIEDSPSSYKSKAPKPRTTQRSRPRELTEIEKDLLIIKNATNGLSSDSECSGRLSSIDVDKTVNPLKRKRVSFSTEGTVVCNGDLRSPVVKMAKLDRESGVSEVGD